MATYGPGSPARRHRRRHMACAAVLALAALAFTGGCGVSVSDPDAPATPSGDGALGTSPTAGAATPPPVEPDAGSLLLIMDASGSMAEQDVAGQVLLDGAKQALRDLVAALPDGAQVGLRVYGHRVDTGDRAAGCRDTELIHPVGPLDRAAMTAAIDQFPAVGFTPIGLALDEGAADLPAEGPRSIILVSDGEDNCAPPDPCEVAEQLQGAGIDVVIHTVGFALGDDDGAREQLRCIAAAGGGEFTDAGNAATLAGTLEDLSVRELRRFEAAGLAIEGAPAPSRAQTGQVDSPHTDLVLSQEVNYYRFEIPAGSTVRGEVVLVGRPDNDGTGSAGAVCPVVSLTDAGDAPYATNTQFGGGPPTGTYIKHTQEVRVDAPEVWVKIDTETCLPSSQVPPVPFDVELQLVVVQ